MAKYSEALRICGEGNREAPRHIPEQAQFACGIELRRMGQTKTGEKTVQILPREKKSSTDALKAIPIPGVFRQSASFTA